MTNFTMKLFLSAILLIACFTTVLAQEIHIPRDIQGRRFLTKQYAELKGSPYLFKDWAKGTAVMMNGARFEGLLKYDQLEDVLLYKTDKGEESVFADPVFEFVIEDTQEGSTSKTRHFKKGFGSSPTDKESNNLFFEVLHDGAVSLVKRTEKSIVEETVYNSASKIHNVKEQNTYYIYRNAVVTKFKNTDKGVLAVLADKKPELEKYIKDQRLNFKRDADLIKLVAYYNTL